MSDKSTADPWTLNQSHDVSPQNPNGIELEEVPIAPLGPQFGAAEPQSVPEDLFEPLFGDVPSENETPLGTFALLDGAKFPDLIETLEATDLDYRCLFKGDSFDEMADVAPWLVELPPNHTFTRSLFTHDPENPMPWHLWTAEPGIYFRAHATLDDLWRHFRKFTRIQDEDGKWFYFRFWEPRAFREIVAQYAHRGLFALKDELEIKSVIAPTIEHTTILRIPSVKRPEPDPKILPLSMRSAFDQSITNRFARDYAKTLEAAAPNQVKRLGLGTRAPIEQLVGSMVGYLQPLGFEKRSDIGRMSAMALFFGTHFLHDPRVAALGQTHLMASTKLPSLRAKNFDEALQNTQFATVVAENDALPNLVQQLRSCINAEALEPDWLAQIYTVEAGFSSRKMAQDFAKACRQQQENAGITEPKLQRAHFILAVIATPYFLVDPLHQVLQRVFLEGGIDFEARLLAVLDRRTNASDIK